MNAIDWALEPDIDELRQAYGLIGVDPSQAIRRLEELAGRGSVMSIWYLADFYLSGKFVPKDIERAKFWWIEAENRGLAHASYMLGDIYFSSQQYELARREFSKGLKDEYYPSIYRLAVMYRDGTGGEQNLPEARLLFRMGAERKHLFSKRELAGMYIRGYFGPIAMIFGVLVLISLLYDVLVYGIQRAMGKETSTMFAYPHELS